MEHKQEPQQQQKVLNEVFLGDIILKGHQPIEVLISFAVQMLKEKSVQKYLEVIRQKRINGGISYVG